MLLTTVVASCSAFAAALADERPPDDPETFMTNPEIIRYWGYPAEEHNATTADGYVLGLHRIPYGRGGPPEAGVARPVVFLQHGLESDSISWILNMPEQAAGFVFADAGFDVWLGNSRGNTYSKSHVYLTAKDEKFWEFSFDEMARYDVDAMVDYVLSVTGQSSVYYAGHSQGTESMFIRLSIDAAFGKKIKKYFALAPVSAVCNVIGPMRDLADRLTTDVELWYTLFGSSEFLPNDDLMQLFAQWICGTTEEGEDRCDDIMAYLLGPEAEGQFNKSRTEVLIAHNPAGTSTRNVLHWAQLVEQGGVRRFDYGTESKNYKAYGQTKPPEYDFSTIKTDMYLYWSDADYLADEKDIKEYLIPALNPDYVKVLQYLPNYTHIDFIWGLKATADIYLPMIDIISDDFAGSK